MVIFHHLGTVLDLAQKPLKNVRQIIIEFDILNHAYFYSTIFGAQAHYASIKKPFGTPRISNF